MMKHWQKMIPVLVTGLGILSVGLTVPTGQAQEESVTPRKMIYLFSTDFPPNPVAQYPSPAKEQTRFWQLLDKEMATTSDLTLTENLEHADYRVELRCSGIFNCSQLDVNIKNANREVLGSFKLKKFAPMMGMGKPNLELIASTLTQRLDERLKMINRGGFGATD